MTDHELDLVESFSRLKRMERRLYRITEEHAVPNPGGIAYRAIAYFVITELVMVAWTILPVLGATAGLVTAPIRFLALPIFVTGVLMQVTPDGRPGHRYAWSVARILLRRVCWRFQSDRAVYGGRVRMRWDEHGPVLRRARIVGPARVRFSGGVRLVERRGRLVVRDGSQRDVVIVPGPGEPMDVKP